MIEIVKKRISSLTVDEKISVGSYYELRHGEGCSCGVLMPDSNTFAKRYYDRVKMHREGKITWEEVYDLEQVRLHAQDIRTKNSPEYAEYWAKTELSIWHVSKSETLIEKVEPIILKK